VNDVVTYFSDTGMDYATWSPNFNMHFGYWRWGLSPLSREPMLEEMNRQVFSRLGLEGLAAEDLVVDLGCGVGASMRSLERGWGRRNLLGVTVVPWQVEQAARLGSRVQLASYLDLPLESGSVAAAYALESHCYAHGPDKGDFYRELYRVLKPGGRFVVVDGFTTRERRGRFFDWLLGEISRGWAVDCFPHMPAVWSGLQELGFEDLQRRDFSWNIAPTALQAPFLSFGFALSRWLAGERLNRVRWDHLRACLLSLAVGMHRGDFSYCLISGRRPR
jgi:SAM-dependent methyltransferase